MSLPAAVVFDLDDTLHDTRGIEDAMLVKLAAAVREEMPDAEADAVIARFRDGRDDFYIRMLRGEWDLQTYRRHHMVATLSPWGEPSEELLARTLELRDSHLGQARYVADAVEVLRELRAAGVRTTLLTNGQSRMQRQKVELLGLEDHIDAIGISEEIGHPKPDREAYLGALALIDADPAEAMMVGDHLDWDVRGALDAGLAGAVWVDAHAEDEREVPPRATRVAALRDVPAALRRLYAGGS